MSLLNCIPGLIADGKIRKGDGEAAERSYRRHYRRLAQSMSPEAAAAEASDLALRELEYDNALKSRQAFLQIAAQRRIGADMEALGGGPGAAIKLLANGPGRNILNVEAQHKAVLGRIHARMEGVLAAHSRSLIGETRDKSGLRDLVRERFGEKTGNRSAAELAEAFGAAVDYARQRFNRAGGNIGKRADWGLPQVHDAMKVRAVPYEQWRGDILKGLAPERMIDDATGQPFTPESLEEALADAYATIRSDGWNRRTPGGAGKGKLANRRADHRFFVFRDADSWLAYQERYGTGNAFDAMMGHAEGMARDIALIEVMGPNPNATLRWLQDGVRKQAAEADDPTGKGIDAARAAERRLGDLYDVVTGAMNSPVNALWARRMGGTRSFLTSALLGSASLSAVSDVGFQAVTRAYNGLPVTGALTGYLKLLNPAAKADRRLAVRLGLIAEEASKLAASLNRYVDGTHTPETMARLSDFVLRVSGLSPWTQAGRWAFGMETLGHLADVRGSSWNNLDAPFRRLLERYGIDEAGWDSIRATETYKHKGAEFLRPDDVADEALGDALLRMVLTETDYAVPTTTARARATLSFGQRPGTLGGEIIRNAALFKSFGVSMVLTHGARMMEGTPWSRVRYFAGLTIGTTLLGALIVQMKEATRGRDYQDMEDPAFWMRATLQGGGFGIFGDFVNGAQRNRFGGGFAETLAGPVVGAAGDVARSGVEIATDALDPSQDVNAGKEAMKLIRRYTPGGSVFYTRLAWERFVLDEIQQWADPDYYDGMRRMEDAAAERGQEYYWRPGELAPERAPQMAERPD